MNMEINSFRTNAIYTDATAARVYKMEKMHQIAHGRLGREKRKNGIIGEQKGVHSPNGEHQRWGEGARGRASADSYSMLAGVLHIIHFIFLQAAFSTAAAAKARLLLTIAGRCL